MHTGQRCGAQREEFGVDGGEHGLKAAVAVSQWETQQVQQALGEADRGQEVEVWKKVTHTHPHTRSSSRASNLNQN